MTTSKSRPRTPPNIKPRPSKKFKSGWSYTCYWYTGTGADRDQHSKGGFETIAEAQRFRNKVAPQVDDGTWQAPTKMTVAELMGQWFAAKSVEGLKPSSLEQYRYVNAAWIVPHLGHVPVLALNPQHVSDLVEELRTDGSALGRGGLGDRSLQITVGNLKSATRWAEANGIIQRDPIRGVKRPKVAPRRVEPWSAEEARKFVQATSEDRLRALWALLLARGLRRGEALGLKWSVVNLNGRDPETGERAGSFPIVNTRIVEEGKAVDSTPKTDAGKRTIQLDEQLVTILEAHRARMEGERAATLNTMPDTGYVFVDEGGQPFHPEAISTKFETLVRQHGLRPVHLHDTRHHAATSMMSDPEVNPKVVSEVLGHHDIAITLRYYSHVMPGQAAKAGKRHSATLFA